MSPKIKVWLIASGAIGTFWLIFTISIYHQPKDLDAQLKTFEKISTGDDLWHRGLLVHRLGDHEKALSLYNQALQINPNAAYAYMFRGKLKYDRDDYPGAIEDFTSAIETDPALGFAVSARSVARYRNGDKKGALADLERTREKYPKEEFPHINRAIMEKLDGNLAVALEMLTTAYEETHDVRYQGTAILEFRGDLKYQMNDFAGALEDYNMFLEMKPDKFRAYLARSKVYEALGNSETAKADMELYRTYARKYNASLRALQKELNPDLKQ